MFSKSGPLCDPVSMNPSTLLPISRQAFSPPTSPMCFSSLLREHANFSSTRIHPLPTKTALLPSPSTFPLHYPHPPPQKGNRWNPLNASPTSFPPSASPAPAHNNNKKNNNHNSNNNNNNPPRSATLPPTAAAAAASAWPSRPHPR